MVHPESRILNPQSRIALIAGAGIGGLAAGIALRRAGWDVRIFERARSPRELGFALALAPNALAALREIGIAETVAREGGAVRVFDVRRADGTLLKRIRFERATRRSMVVLRTVLHGALLAAVGDDALNLGHEVRGIELQADCARLLVADRAPASADVVIGADGVASVIRGCLHPDEPSPRPSGYHAI
ncbi:MAG TPA: FAD-dependent monooxygenase, partial [Vicinamibacterales bacterium]|nr:FAD-dependent monooxygenase [Vicinamibacterales bacterium]